MAGDKLFQKRRAQRAEEARRVAVERKEKRRFLIVCEGETEEAYFQYYADRQPDLITEITSNCGTSPMCVTSHAVNLARKDGDFDEVFAIFDGDTTDIKNFERAILMAKNSSEVSAIHSTPCFEYWLMLHFSFSRKPFVGIKNAKSAGTQILSELKTCPGMESYTKGEKLNFPSFVGRIETAIENSKTALSQAINEQQRNPSTLIHQVISAIRGEEEEDIT